MASPSYSSNLLILLLNIFLSIYFIATPCRTAVSAATAAFQYFSSILLAYFFSIKDECKREE